ncbi:heterokaryon incompatibility protein-domain-containing protein [Cadophora sp. MPI-SDFR-AT-0126]|nr:heterokaryon incompatibility protein-domain-containing protein [Leotiomycetes sp. MPI-SDFR-AT-0126]
MNDRCVDTDATFHQQFTYHPMSTTEYMYQPLSKTAFEIRLLQLLPASLSSDIRVLISITPFEDSNLPDYEALSYTWGSTEDPQMISVGTDGIHSLTVTRNLAEALPYLRLRDKPRTLWIDAACINQKDLKERSRQVQRMADIYSKARRVLVWLGKESEDSSLAVECVRTLSSKIEIDPGIMKVLPRTDEKHWLDWKAKLPFNVEQTMALARLCNRDWFKRLWIWQEVRCARDVEVMCGTDSMSWKEIQVLGYFCLHKSWDQAFYDNVSRITRFLLFNLCGLVGSNSFFALIDQTKHSLCSDPKDRIYALASMAAEGDLHVEPDYEKPTSEVFHSFVIEYIRHHGDLKVLTQVESHKDTNQCLPSWVPEFSIPRAANPFIQAYVSGSSSCYFNFPDERKLEVNGVVISTVAYCEACRLHSTSDVGPEDVREELIRMMSEIRLRGKIEWSREHVHGLLQALFSGAFADNYFPKLTSDEVVNASQLEELLRKLLMLVSNAGEPPAPLSVSESLVMDAVAGFLLDRSIVLSSDGRIALAPQDTQTGDVLAVLLGCDSPMLLRPLDNDEYIVIGEAFYDGAMYGELLLGPFPEGFRPVWQYNEKSRSYLISFLHGDSKVFRVDDPRLEGVALPSGWERKEQGMEITENNFVNHDTGENMGSCDPRLNIEFFKSRGAKIESLTLV